MLQTGWTTRLYVLNVLFFALGILLAPAWHAAQAATPADCCEGEGAVAHAEPAPTQALTDASCCCCPGGDEAALADENDAPTPDPDQEQDQQPAPCPTDGNCPCCKSMVIVSVAVPLPTAAVSSISDEPRDLWAANPASPDSRGLATEPQPPKR